MVHCFEHFKTKGVAKVVVAPSKKLDKYIKGDDTLYVERNKFFPIFPALKLAKIIDEYSIDLLHFHWTKDIATVILAKLISKQKPKIMQTRNMTMTRFKDDFYHKWLYKNVDIMHAVTYQVKEQLQRFIPSDVSPKIEVVYMGTSKSEVLQERVASLQKSYGICRDDFVVGIVGRIEEGKGQWMVIEAISKLKEPNIKALIVGHTMDERYLESLKQKVKELDLNGRVIFSGFTKEVNEHFNLCDVSVLATPRETFGLVVIESMVNRVPVIATNNGGPLEIIDDGKDGLLFDRSVDDLKDKIDMLFKDKQMKERLAKNAYTKAIEKFDKTTQLEKLYAVCIG